MTFKDHLTAVASEVEATLDRLLTPGSDLAPGEAMSRLRRDEEAGPHVEALERWLHRPVEQDDLDLERMLAPYERVDEPLGERGVSA